MMSAPADPGLGLALGAGFGPPMLTGWADPMFVPGAIAATSAAWVIKRPAEAARAADVAAMAPGTNIGSAHPVSIGGPNPAPNASPSPGSAGADIMTQKIENDAAAYIRSLAT